MCPVLESLKIEHNKYNYIISPISYKKSKDSICMAVRDHQQNLKHPQSGCRWCQLKLHTLLWLPYLCHKHQVDLHQHTLAQQPPMNKETQLGHNSKSNPQHPLPRLNLDLLANNNQCKESNNLSYNFLTICNLWFQYDTKHNNKLSALHIQQHNLTP